MTSKKVGWAMVLFLGFCLPAGAQQKPSDETRLARIEERLTRLEKGQKALGQRIDDLRADINARFADMNNRFDDLKSRFGGMVGPPRPTHWAKAL